ncbi:LpqB family beta-propeller domain-containing protein [Sphingomonas sp. SRS2]|uniref:LpqB family beta-propeller domain-containing protein n=1 Tax=Sphingomonas sp. SRS2 TaxID=133190 RepID=UPI001F3407F7|nr:LpqB family beta-propeller domain-containing protein [Sphingomonas sp. SRS2]
MRSIVPALVAAALASAPVSGNGPAWDVENTGQPYTNVSFTVSEGSWMSLDVSPDGKTILFDMLGDIYALPATGGKATLIKGGAAMQRDPRFSPDGSRIAFISDHSGGDNVWIDKIDGSDPRQITSETTNALTGPAWTFDGGAIAAARMPDSDHKLHNAELRLFQLSGGKGQLLVAQPTVGENVHEAQFSRDGRYLYYTEKLLPPTKSVVYLDANHAQYAIKRRTLATGATEELIRGFGGATTPRPSPDGKRIAFVRRVMAKTVLFSYDIGTGEQRPIFDGLDRDSQADYTWQGSYYPQYAWFPDNRHVAIWAKGKLWKVDMENGAHSPIPFSVTAHHKPIKPPVFTHDMAPGTFMVRAIRQLAYTPSGDTVLFNALGRLWRKDRNGEPVRLTRSTALEFEPAISPDGRSVVYVEWRDEQGGALKLRNLATGVERTLVTSGGVLRQPSFSADGKRLVYKIDAGDRCLGGHAAEPGMYWIDLAGSESHPIGPPGEAPMFSPDGTRVYYVIADYMGEEMVSMLESIDLNGRHKRTHVRTPDADTSELRISPDLQWIAFRDRQQYYVARYRDSGAPMMLTAATTETPVVRISEIGGYSLLWSRDSQKLHWATGPTLESVRIDGPALKVSKLANLETRLIVPSDKPSSTIAFTNARILTMAADDKVIEKGTVVVRGNRIAAIGSSDQVKPPAGAKVYDVAGKTIMPGLIDMHGHLNNCYYTSSGLMPQKQSSRYAALAFGVTTNYDPYTSELPSYSQAEMTMSGDMVGPRAIESGFIAFGRRGKGDSAYIPIDSYGDAKTLMERKSALGGWIVKSYRQPMRSARQQLVKAGRDTGLMVDVEGESNFYNNVTMVLDGNTNLQHNMPIANYYDDVVQLMKGAGAHHTPTLVVVFGELFGENYIYQTERVWDDPKVKTFVQVATSGYNPLGTGHYAPPQVRGMSGIRAADEIWDIGFRSVARSMKKLDDAGVTVNAGSHGELSGLAQHWELELLSQGGMAPMRLLRTTTINVAKTLGVDDQIGSLEEGKLADLIVLDKNPLEDIRNSRSVIYTMVNGRLYDAATVSETGSRELPRSKFYWEVGHINHIVDWKKAWAHQ